MTAIIVRSNPAEATLLRTFKKFFEAISLLELGMCGAGGAGNFQASQSTSYLYKLLVTGE